MKLSKVILLSAMAVMLAACAGGLSSGGTNEFYGEIKTGIESSHTRIGR
ncbi:hypothetical protein [Bergeriella denitrificans]|uniref:Lipoprotein n=1 Tax=Bergeriella denitrificans TaxID=494 RepID=A0A378UKG5_BERDE|nr:hypothetical protein [Bergeriella denitrificans]STZ76981.1 Uncharacterised protein [Bergeriella denitrificans]